MGPRVIISGLQEAPELLGARRVAELAEGLGLDLPDALAGHGEVLADLLERVLAPVGQAEAQAQHLFLPRGERVEHLGGGGAGGGGGRWGVRGGRAAWRAVFSS